MEALRLQPRGAIRWVETNLEKGGGLPAKLLSNFNNLIVMWVRFETKSHPPGAGVKAHRAQSRTVSPKVATSHQSLKRG
ncbi:hypothetical protein [Calothrix sp. UHCC 0171]|uniref:hypothetical protein n=1 Tax=Calothrix sp. UHCC 0171 TaxID=3110245 RepID=UPI002B206150|nr:hypothetical protein [Calothrix sp. UHCC 0171]MEA5569798.1 hypothetical protein [Calothrix sp. UHCC 0171]